MVKEHFILKMVYLGKVNGKMEKELNGHPLTKLYDYRYLIWF